MKQLLDREATGAGMGNGMSLFGMSPLPHFAKLFNLDERTLLARHTVLPFATAFATHDVWSRAVDGALAGVNQGRALGAVIQSAVHGIPNRRFCRTCVSEDLRTLGESYWRLTHQLPGSLVCHVHGEVLRSTDLRIAGISWSYDLPEDCAGTPCGSGGLLVDDVWRRVAVRSAELAQRELAPPERRAGTYYRDLAMERGWLSANRLVRAERVAQVLLDVFGKKALSACGLLPTERNAWPCLMLQARPGSTFTTLKHVLMDEFLTRPVSDLTYKPSGPSARPTAEADKTYVAAVKKVANEYAKAGRRARVADVLRQAGCWGPYRHARAGTLPKLTRLVKSIQTSALALRPQALQAFVVPGTDGAMATRQDLVDAGHLLYSKEAAKRLGVHWTEMKQLQREGRIFSLRYAARDWYPAFWCEAGADRAKLQAQLQSVRGLAQVEQWASLVRSLAPR